MDEHGQLLPHTVDLVEHWFNGGTHPIDIHEYIMLDSARKAGGKAPVDLGYLLRPSS
jgi:hypothetical protein